MTALELSFLKYIESIRTDFLNSFFEAVTMLGEETILIVLMAIVFFMYDKRLAQRMFFITAVSITFNGVIKNLVQRPRPFAEGKVSCVREHTATGYSFPSGHTQTFATWSMALSYYFKKYWFMLLSVIFTLLIGFSRIYLGAHYPSDVIVGVILGFTFAILLNKLYDKVKSCHVLHGAAALALVPFAVFFLIKPEALYADFYKTYGLIAGLFCATLFEDKLVMLSYNTSLLKKILRVIFGIILALIFKEGLKIVFVASDLRLSLILDALRYFILVFVIMGICPMVFKKLKM